MKLNNLEMDDSWYCGWAMEGGHDREIALLEKMEDMSPLYGDMLFQRGSKSHDLIVCQTDSFDGNGALDIEDDLPPAIDYFTYFWFHPKVEELEGCNGYFNEAKQEICVSVDRLDDDRTLMHEMIHLHEFVINQLPMYFHDMLYWALYTELRERIPQLDEIITGHAHLLTGTMLYAEGGTHDILFLLKSFDLDMRMGYPLGTVFGYGKSDEFSSYGYDA